MAGAAGLNGEAGLRRALAVCQSQVAHKCNNELYTGLWRVS